MTCPYPNFEAIHFSAVYRAQLKIQTTVGSLEVNLKGLRESTSIRISLRYRFFTIRSAEFYQFLAYSWLM